MTATTSLFLPMPFDLPEHTFLARRLLSCNLASRIIPCQRFFVYMEPSEGLIVPKSLKRLAGLAVIPV
jgi:hypothetical protein